jgi:hypothetical protein
MNIQWEYEKEGYSLGELGYYLPDFWLSEYDTWAEVKPMKFTKQERAKISKLSHETQCDAILLDGLPGDRSYCMINQGCFNDVIICDYHGHLYVSTGDPEKNTRVGSGAATSACFDVMDAVKAALSARFEFGESG